MKDACTRKPEGGELIVTRGGEISRNFEEIFTTDLIPKIYRTEMGNIRVELDSKDYTYIFSKDHKTLSSYIDTKAEIINLTEGSK